MTRAALPKPVRGRPTPRYTFSATPSVITVRMNVDSMTNWEQWFQLAADRHWDNPDCDRELCKRHLNQAIERRAGILEFGDTFCMMQGKYDKRSDKSKVRPEHQHGDYLDRVITTAADFYQPYAPNLIMLADGNHETSIIGRHETDPIERVVGILNDRTGAKVVHGGYTGWVRFMFNRSNQTLSRRLWYCHGYGGGGPVTLDTIQAQRQRTYIENADIMVTGHTHDAWAMDTIKMRLNDAGTIERRTLWQVKCPTYKDEYHDGRGGWHVGTGKPPKPLGCWWLRFWWDGTRGLREQIVRAD